MHERTVAELATSRSHIQQMAQQVRALEWQLSILTQQAQQAQQRAEAGQRELAAQLQQVAAQGTACTAELERERAARADLAAATRGDGARGRPNAPEDLRKLTAALDTQHARLLERVTRLEQKLDALAAEERRARPSPSQPDRSFDAEVVDPWGFGSRR